MASNPQVHRMLKEMLDSGKTPEEVCRDCPELLPEVRERWKAFCLIDAEVGQPLREQEPGPLQPPLHGLLGNPDHRGRLGVGQPLDADQVEHLPLVLGEALNHLQHASAPRTTPTGET